jgi:CBS domain-containing protein
MKVGNITLFLKEVVPFDILETAELNEIAEHTEELKFAAGEMIFKQNETKVEGVYLIRKGCVHLTDERQEQLDDVLAENEHFGGVTILMNRPGAIRTIEATEETLCYFFPKELFLKLCQKNELFSQFFIKSLSTRLLKQYRESRGAEREDDKFGFNTVALTLGEVANRTIISCDENATIKEAAAIMAEQGSSSILITSGEDNYVGIVTDTDLRKRVIAAGVETSRPIREIMSAPLKTMDASQLYSDGMLTLLNEGLQHLVLKENTKVCGTVTQQDCLVAQSVTPVTLVRTIERAKHPEELFEVPSKLPGITKRLFKEGMHAENISRVLSSLNEKLTRKFLYFAEKELGRPPVLYCFINMGSAGRMEQTFKTDQDNAIIREESPRGMEEEVNEWFLKFGTLICDWLNDAGFPYCDGGIMAKNQKWNQPISKWKQYFRDWVTRPTPEEMLNSLIFFDLKPVSGLYHLADDLKDDLRSTLLKGAPIFFTNMAQAVTDRRPPLSIFRTFVLEKDGEHKATLDLKTGGSSLIVDIARIYALKEGIMETNTQERIRAVAAKKKISRTFEEDMLQAYDFLMQIRFQHQIQLLEAGLEPDNHLDPSNISMLEKKILKETFKLLSDGQEKMLKEFNPSGIR